MSVLFICSCQDRKEVIELALSNDSVRMNDDFIIGSPIKMHCLNNDLLIINAKLERTFHWIKISECKYMGGLDI